MAAPNNMKRRGNPSRVGRKCPDCAGAGGFLLGMAGRGGIDPCRKCKGTGRIPSRGRIHCVCGRPGRRGFTHTTGSCYRTPPSRRNPDEWGGSGDRMDRRPRTVRPLAVCDFGLCTRRADVVVKGRPACRAHAAQLVRRNPSRRRSKSPRRPALTRSLAWSVATDAANRAMRARGRSAWSRVDYNVAVRTFARLWPKSRENPDPRTGKPRLDELPLKDRMAACCACGECGLNPAKWACESRRDARKVAAARAVLERTGFYDRRR